MSDTIIIDEARAIELLEQAVEEKGADYVYPHLSECVYFSEDPDGTPAPSCIVGHVFDKLGVVEGDLETKMTPGRDVTPNSQIVFALSIKGVDLEQGALRVLRAAQVAQDDGKRWGEALQAAKFAQGTL